MFSFQFRPNFSVASYFFLSLVKIYVLCPTELKQIPLRFPFIHTNVKLNNGDLWMVTTLFHFFFRQSQWKTRCECWERAYYPGFKWPPGIFFIVENGPGAQWSNPNGSLTNTGTLECRTKISGITGEDHRPVALLLPSVHGPGERAVARGFLQCIPGHYTRFHLASSLYTCSPSITLVYLIFTPASMDQLPTTIAVPWDLSLSLFTIRADIKCTRVRLNARLLSFYNWSPRFLCFFSAMFKVEDK